MPDIKRQTAYKCKIEHILHGNYVVQQGWEPNYIELENLKISRINVIATILDKQNNVLTIDDGTGKIEVRVFENPEKLNTFNVGDVLLIIGRPREYNNQKYIVPEILRKIEDKNWVKYRKKELELSFPQINVKKETIKKEVVEVVEEKPVEKTNYSQILLDIIRKLDKGDGADIQKVIDESKLNDAQKQLDTLLNEGEIFEIRAGKLKILE